MAQQLLKRLKDYFINEATALLCKARAAVLYANSTDIGISRENAYSEFLKCKLPCKCKTFFGGAVFDDNGNESKQLDIIIATDTVLFFSTNNEGKIYTNVEGVLGIASIKSMLNKRELYNALLEIASIPHTKPLDGRIPPGLNIKDYDDWPFKIIFAIDGIDPKTILDYLNEFYHDNPTPINRRPNCIHVSQKYLIVRATNDMCTQNLKTGNKETLLPGSYYLFDTQPDLQAIINILRELQIRAADSTYIHYSYDNLFNNILING